MLLRLSRRLRSPRPRVGDLLHRGEAREDVRLVAVDPAEVVQEEQVAVRDAEAFRAGDELLVVVRVEKLVGADVRKRRVVRAEGARDDPGRERVQELAQDDAVPEARAETLSGRRVGWVGDEGERWGRG